MPPSGLESFSFYRDIQGFFPFHKKEEHMELFSLRDLEWIDNGMLEIVYKTIGSNIFIVSR